MKGKKLIAILGAIAMLGCTAGGLAACENLPEGFVPGIPGSVEGPDPGNPAKPVPEESPFDDNDDPTKVGGDFGSGAIGKTSGEAVTDYYTDKDIQAYNYKKGTYRTYTVTVPGDWNEMSSMDENDQQIMSYLSSAFYEYDYLFDEEKGGKFKADGSINKEAIVDGKFDVKFSAATKLEDVTETYAEDWGYTESEVKAGGYAWKITLRDDLKWDDGTPIEAADFVYTMQQQLDPKFGFERANSFFGAISIKGAQSYAYQGKSGWFAASSPYGHDYKEELNIDDKIVFSLGSPTENEENGKVECSVRTDMGVPGTWGAKDFANYIVNTGINSKAEATVEEIMALEGKTYAEIKADEKLAATFEAVAKTWRSYETGEELDFFITNYTYPKVDFSKVGLFSPSKYELVVCFTTSEAFLKEDGSLSYLAAYEMASLPLVKRDLFEASIQEPAEGKQEWTTNYNATLETTASWGPFKLTAYQAGKGYTLSKNEHWYGYKLIDNKNQYNIEEIKCDCIKEVETQWMSMFKGEIDSIGIDAQHAKDYRNSKYTYYTRGTYTFSWHLFSGLDALKESGRNNGILAIDDFRKALSLSIDRDAYAATITTAYRGAFGYFNQMYYYDVENGGVFRNTDVAKKGLLRAYGYVENEEGKWSLEGSLVKDYDLEAAYESITGFNLTLAKEYVKKAYDRLTKYASYYGYDPTKKIQIKFGTNADNDSTRLEYNYINETVLPNLLKDTPLEGKVEVVFDASFGNSWSEAFAAGQYELCTSAWGNAAFNPHYFIGAYVDPANAYTASYWDTEKVTMTMTVPGKVGDFAGAGKVRTMTVMNWYRCLNGYEHPESDKYKYDWGEGKMPAEARNEILAALEEFVLTQYYSIPTITQNSATLVGAKFSYISDDYNTFMGYGGMRYRIVNYTDAEWDAFVAEKGGDLKDFYKVTDTET